MENGKFSTNKRGLKMFNRNHEFFSNEFLYKEKKEVSTEEQEARKYSEMIMKDLKNKYCEFKGYPEDIEFDIEMDIEFGDFCEMLSYLEGNSFDLQESIKDYLWEIESKKSYDLNLMVEINEKLNNNGKS
jgi:hypothetical protein